MWRPQADQANRRVYSADFSTERYSAQLTDRFNYNN